MPNEIHLLRLPEVLRRIPVSKSTWFDGVQKGRFPKPVKIGRTSAWRNSDINKLIDSLALEDDA